MRATFRFLLIGIVALGVSCTKNTPPPKTADDVVPPPSNVEPPANILVSDCEPKSAEVVVDGQSHGSVEELSKKGGVRVTTGVHRIEIRAPGHKAFRVELNIGDKPETLKIKLQASQGDQ